jgi:hypothetical protein
VRVGDWVRTARTMTFPGADEPIRMLVTVRVVGIDSEKGVATLETETATAVPGDEPHVQTETGDVPLKALESLAVLDFEGMETEVLEEGLKTLEAGGRTHENAPWKKMRMSDGDDDSFVIDMEAWEDPGAVMALARNLKVTMRETITFGDEGSMVMVTTVERLGFGRER